MTIADLDKKGSMELDDSEVVSVFDKNVEKVLDT